MLLSNIFKGENNLLLIGGIIFIGFLLFSDSDSKSFFEGENFITILIIGALIILFLNEEGIC